MLLLQINSYKQHYFGLFFSECGRFTNNTKNYTSYCCDQYQSFINASLSFFVKNQRKTFCCKYCTFSTIESPCHGTLVFDSNEQCKKHVTILLKTHDCFLSVSGTELKSKLLTFQIFFCRNEPHRKIAGKLIRLH